MTLLRVLYKKYSLAGASLTFSYYPLDYIFLTSLVYLFKTGIQLINYCFSEASCCCC